MNTEPTEAHKQMACDLLNAAHGVPDFWTVADDGTDFVVTVPARLIAELDASKPDPLLIEAREIVGAFAESVEGYQEYASDYRNGKRDKDSEIQVALAALKHARGLHITEIAK